MIYVVAALAIVTAAVWGGTVYVLLAFPVALPMAPFPITPRYRTGPPPAIFTPDQLYLGNLSASAICVPRGWQHGQPIRSWEDVAHRRDIEQRIYFGDDA